MRTHCVPRNWIVVFVLFFCIGAAGNAFGQAGTWTSLKNAQPIYGTAVLLTDGTVLVMADEDTACSRLKPDASGSYINGTWLPTASMNDSRLYFASVVLPDSRVFVAGGEYGTGRDTAEIYDPVQNTWTRAAGLWGGQAISDATAKVLPDGRVLLFTPPTKYGWIYDPGTNKWSQTNPKIYDEENSEESYAELPGGIFLAVENAKSPSRAYSQASKYIASLNQWVATGPVPVNLLENLSGDVPEIGPGVLLYDGRVLYLGGNGNTAFYTPPSTPTDPGVWAAGLKIPNGLMCDDAPAAVMPNGHVLFVADAGDFNDPSAIFEYDPVLNAYTDVGGPSGSPCFIYRMLMLPTGQVFLPENSMVYTPVGSPSSAWQPAVTSITANSDGSYKLTGTQLNGLTEGAYYGDDAQMASNYPIVRLVSGSAVHYAKTSNFSTMGVATGGALVSTNFSVAGIPNGSYSLYVVANGIASSPFKFNIGTAVPVISSEVLETGWSGHPFTYAITATGNPTSYNAAGLPSGLVVNTATGAISGTPAASGTFNVTLSAKNAAGTGTATLVLTIYSSRPAITSELTDTATAGYPLTYPITATGGPVSFAASPLPAGLAVNASTGVISGTPAVSGSFSVTLSATNPIGTGTATLKLTINPRVLTTIAIWPGSVKVPTSGARQFAATANDQFGNKLSPQPTFTWTVLGGGTISSSGLFQAGATAGGPYTVKAASGSVSGTAAVSVYVPVLTTISVAPSAANVPIAGSKQFAASAKDQNGIALATQPVFTWTVSGGGVVSNTGLFTAGKTVGGPFTIKAASGSVSGAASVSVYSNPPSITSALTATGTVGTAFSYRITASNGPASFSAAGLPGGLSLNASTGAITGTPVAAGIPKVTIGATNASGTGTGTLALTIKAAPAAPAAAAATVPPAITSAASASPPAPTVGETVTFVIAADGADGGALNYSWSFGDGGTDSGTTVAHAYAASGTYTAVVTVSDDQGETNTSSVTITATPAAADSSIDLGTVKAGQKFKLQLDTLETGKARWSAVDRRQLPPGVSLSASGILGGKPKTPGVYTFQLRIKAKAKSVTHSCTLTVER